MSRMNVSTASAAQFQQQSLSHQGRAIQEVGAAVDKGARVASSLAKQSRDKKAREDAEKARLAAAKAKAALKQAHNDAKLSQEVDEAIHKLDNELTASQIRKNKLTLDATWKRFRVENKSNYNKEAVEEARTALYDHIVGEISADTHLTARAREDMLYQAELSRTTSETNFIHDSMDAKARAIQANSQEAKDICIRNGDLQGAEAEIDRGVAAGVTYGDVATVKALKQDARVGVTYYQTEAKIQTLTTTDDVTNYRDAVAKTAGYSDAQSRRLQGLLTQQQQGITKAAAELDQALQQAYTQGNLTWDMVNVIEDPKQKAIWDSTFAQYEQDASAALDKTQAARKYRKYRTPKQRAEVELKVKVSESDTYVVTERQFHDGLATDVEMYLLGKPIIPVGVKEENALTGDEAHYDLSVRINALPTKAANLLRDRLNGGNLRPGSYEYGIAVQPENAVYVDTVGKANDTVGKLIAKHNFTTAEKRAIYGGVSQSVQDSLSSTTQVSQEDAITKALEPIKEQAKLKAIQNTLLSDTRQRSISGGRKTLSAADNAEADGIANTEI